MDFIVGPRFEGDDVIVTCTRCERVILEFCGDAGYTFKRLGEICEEHVAACPGPFYAHHAQARVEGKS